MRTIEVIYSAICKNPKCGATVWYAVREAENPERQFQTIDIPSSLRCAWCLHVFPVTGWDEVVNGPPDLDNPWVTYRTPNESVGLRDRK